MESHKSESCSKCHSELKKGVRLNSANTIFQEWVCTKCNTKTMKAVGTA
jgi:transposase-like protein